MVGSRVFFPLSFAYSSSKSLNKVKTTFFCNIFLRCSSHSIIFLCLPFFVPFELMRFLLLSLCLVVVAVVVNSFPFLWVTFSAAFFRVSTSSLSPFGAVHKDNRVIRFSRLFLFPSQQFRFQTRDFSFRFLCEFSRRWFGNRSIGA